MTGMASSLYTTYKVGEKFQWVQAPTTLHVRPKNSTPALSRGFHFCFHTGYPGTPFANEDSCHGPADGSIPVLHANVVAKVESKGIVTEADSQRFVALLGRLNILTDQATAAHALGDTLNLARRYKLSAYDAAYFELARSISERTGLGSSIFKGIITKLFKNLHY